jgi:two-component system cell cycle response regulator CpdR
LPKGFTVDRVQNWVQAQLKGYVDPDIKVMFITGFAAVALNPDNNAPKDAKILSKPFHLRDLVSEVQRLLAA